MQEELFVELRQLRQVVNLYFHLVLQDKIKKKDYVLARQVYLKLIDTYYQDKENKPSLLTMCSMMGLANIHSIHQMRISANTLPDLDKHFNILKHYIVEDKDKFTNEQIKQMLIDGKLTLTDVIDATIDVNNLIGVGLISLSDGIDKYIMTKIKRHEEI